MIDDNKYKIIWKLIILSDMIRLNEESERVPS